MVEFIFIQIADKLRNPGELKLFYHGNIRTTGLQGAAGFQLQQAASGLTFD